MRDKSSTFDVQTFSVQCSDVKQEGSCRVETGVGSLQRRLRLRALAEMNIKLFHFFGLDLRLCDIFTCNIHWR